jgi:hypothetical protein
MGVGPVGHPEGSAHRRPRQHDACPRRRFRTRASRGGMDARTHARMQALTLAHTHTRSHAQTRTRVRAWHALPFDAAAGQCACGCACVRACVRVGVRGCLRVGVCRFVRVYACAGGWCVCVCVKGTCVVFQDRVVRRFVWIRRRRAERSSRTECKGYSGYPWGY